MWSLLYFLNSGNGFFINRGSSFVIFILFDLNLFLHLCNHPLLAENVLMSPGSEDLLLKSCSCLPATNVMMPFLTWCSACIAAITFAVWGVKTSTDVFFLCHNFTEDLFLPKILATSAYNSFSFLIKSRTFNFSLKGSLFQLLLVYLNCPHHHCGALDY